MTRTPWRLVPKHLRAHWVRTSLTVAGMTVAIFLFCFLRTMVTTLDNAVATSSDKRIITQSAVSLFVDLPLDYQPKIESVPGVDVVTKFQWFGGYFQDPSQFFAQFGVDSDTFFEAYEKDIRLIRGPGGAQGDAARDEILRAFRADRRAAIVGTDLVRDFGWEVGDTVPVIGTIFQRADQSAWEFNIVGVYEPAKANVDERTLFFRYDYLYEALVSSAATGPVGVGVYSINLAAETDAAVVTDEIDALFANGPQRTWTTTEAAFQASFISMMGNLPVFVGTIGGAVVFAVLFTLMNTMILAGRQRRHEAGILKALGFGDGVLARLMLAESLLLSMLGGACGLGFSLLTAPAMKAMFSKWFPNYGIAPDTVVLGALLCVGIGVIAGIGPAVSMARMEATEALRSED